MVHLVRRNARLNAALLRLMFLFFWPLAGCHRDSPEAHQEGPKEGPKERGHVTAENPLRDGAYHVFPGQQIQAALNLAANDPVNKTVKIHAGTYRPSAKAFALVHLNRRHDRISVEAVGDVILTAGNPAVADEKEPSFPAVVNHVVYFGDGISEQTTLRGCKITGANGFLVSPSAAEAIEPARESPTFDKGLFFYRDGGAIKVFGRSYPTIENVDAYGNSTSLCGGAVSVEHRGFTQNQVRFRNCIFKDNHCPGTGSAIDLLPGSAAVIQNCLFVGNISNTGMDRIKRQFGLTYNKDHGCGALTVFENSRVRVERCTFTANCNGVDDRGTRNTYHACIFWMNSAAAGSLTGSPFELDIRDGANVRGCYVNGIIDDLQGMVDSQTNTMSAPDPQFDRFFRPLNRVYDNVGYRPGDEDAAHQTDL